jgi:hypothetical protein
VTRALRIPARRRQQHHDIAALPSLPLRLRCRCDAMSHSLAAKIHSRCGSCGIVLSGHKFSLAFSFLELAFSLALPAFSCPPLSRFLSRTFLSPTWIFPEAYIAFAFRASSFHIPKLYDLFPLACFAFRLPGAFFLQAIFSFCRPSRFFFWYHSLPACL